MDLKRFIARLWLYFRMGHSTYLVFLMSFANFIVIFYRLFIEYIPFLTKIFQSLTIFALSFFLMYLPLAIFIGWSHYKRTPFFSSEQDISVESNPYVYKLSPGKETELYIPMWTVLIRFMKESTKQKIIKMPKGFEKELLQIEENIKNLKEGGYVGTPRKKYI